MFLSWRPPIKAVEIYRNDFDADVNMEEVESVDNPPTYSVQNGRLVFSYDAGASAGGRIALAISQQLQANRVVIEAKIENIGGHAFVGIGIHDGQNRLMAIYDKYNGVKKIEWHDSSGDTVLNSVTESITAPVYIRIIIQPTKVDLFESTDGQTWTLKLTADKDIRSMSGFRPSILVGYFIETGASTETVEIDYFEAYYFGGYGARDPTPVIDKHGRLYVDDEGYYYMTVTLAGNTIPNAAAGLIRTRNIDDPSTYELYAIFFTNRGGMVVGDSPIGITVDKDNAIAYLYGSKWGTSDLENKVGVWFKQMSLADVLKQGVILIDNPTDLFDEGWDVVVVEGDDGYWYAVHARANGLTGDNMCVYRGTTPSSFDTSNPVWCTSNGSNSSPIEGGKIIREKGKGIIVLYQQSWVSPHKFYKRMLDGSNEVSWEHGNSDIDSGHPCPGLAKIISHTKNGVYNINWSHGELVALDPPETFFAGSETTQVASFSITSYPSSISASPGATITINVTVANNGDTDGTVEVRVRDHNNSIVASKQVTVAAGGSQSLSLSATAPSSPGTYSWKIEAYNVDSGVVDDSKSFTVEVSEGAGGINMQQIQQMMQLFMQLLPFIMLILLISILVAAIR